MSYLNNPTQYHLEQLRRRNMNMSILANDATSETLHNSFNSSRVSPIILSTDTTQSYVPDPSHIKQKPGSFDVYKVDLDQQVKIQYSTISSPSPVVSPTYRNFGPTEVSLMMYQNYSMDPKNFTDIPQKNHFTDSDESSDNAQKQAILIEKRRHRRELHNAVIKRSPNMKETIQEISTLIPDILIDSSNKQNKFVILCKAIEYIKHLQQLVREQRAHNAVLENIMIDMRHKASIENNGTKINN
ncbi:1470_t:CDS:2 [Cetraspora pellucida]|uniref:1470_t:CDS:1 n=1 Tax=Cetraspora pellucida TaxID=1433469 RepID=A0A9N9NQ40_9GLOM|nr:1470_t:CDS:2 [Cetraspora pellucida]